MRMVCDLFKWHSVVCELNAKELLLWLGCAPPRECFLHGWSLLRLDQSQPNMILSSWRSCGNAQVAAGDGERAAA